MQRERGKENNSKERGGWPPSMGTEHRYKASVTGQIKMISNIRDVFKLEVIDRTLQFVHSSLRY